GLSDRLPNGPTPGSRVDDLRIVMDAAGSERAALFGLADGGPISVMFAAQHPHRVSALAMFGSYARGTSAPDYPWGPTDAELQRFIDGIGRRWGGPVAIDEYAPSHAADARFRAWWSTYLRVGAAPQPAMALTRMNAALDVREVLPALRVRTLVLHRSGDRVAPI